ncbi:MAG: DUF4037 domain-containing protein [Ruminococcus sp.]|nr:DUF4037 domain-containing protein [Ruminococcus sp.]
MINNLFKEFERLEQVEAIALGGSRSGSNFDEKSDYDVYVYITYPISENIREAILSKYCGYMEIGNSYWETEDNCVLNNGIDIDIIYRNLDEFCDVVADVVERYNAHNGYTTCMWHNLLNSKVIYDADKRLEAAKQRFSVPYPEQLRANIINRNLNLLCDAMPAYSHQIEKACGRNDRVSILHRTTAFMESYFDIIFALNSLTHPGEKRLVEICVNSCPVLPNNFEANLNRLFNDMSGKTENVNDDIKEIIAELKAVI